MYTIKELADLAGTTPRALRYYDQLGLLKPASIAENGYRYYDRRNLLILQQILFFRELDVPLKEIQYLLARPDFQLVSSLHTQRESLEKKIQRYKKLIHTIEKTIKNLEGDSLMSPNEIFSGFDESDYEAEVRDRWGDSPQFAESRRKWSSYSESQKEEIKRMGGDIARRMVTEDPNAKPDNPEVQAAIEEYYRYLNEYFYRCDREFLRNLADMWVEDTRFAVNYERIREGGAEFVREAVRLFCDSHQQGK